MAVMLPITVQGKKTYIVDTQHYSVNYREINLNGLLYTPQDFYCMKGITIVHLANAGNIEVLSLIRTEPQKKQPESTPKKVQEAYSEFFMEKSKEFINFLIDNKLKKEKENFLLENYNIFLKKSMEEIESEVL